VNIYVWICATTRKIVARCFDVMLMDTIGDSHLLELKEEALDLTFYSKSLILLESPTIVNNYLTP
jgi:hypothetical protein